MISCYVVSKQFTHLNLILLDWLVIVVAVISGLQSTTAIRAAILKQLSTVFVPLFDSWFFSKEPVR